MISKANLMAGSAKFKNAPFVQIRKDKFSNLPNQVFMWVRSVEEPYCEAMFRVLIDPRSISESFKI
jgi:hypothetical protein